MINGGNRHVPRWKLTAMLSEVKDSQYIFFESQSLREEKKSWIPVNKLARCKEMKDLLTPFIYIGSADAQFMEKGSQFHRCARYITFNYVGIKTQAFCLIYSYVMCLEDQWQHY